MSDTTVTSVAGRFTDRPWLIRPRQVYIAGPFFTSDQVETITEIQRVLGAEQLSFFSPMVECRYDARTDPPVKAEEAFLLNKWHIQNCRFVVVCLSWPDMGTAWELGYADAKGTPRLGVYRPPSGKMNLMLRQTVNALIPLDRLSDAIKEVLLDVVDRGVRSYAGAINQINPRMGEFWEGVQE